MYVRDKALFFSIFMYCWAGEGLPINDFALSSHFYKLVPGYTTKIWLTSWTSENHMTKRLIFLKNRVSWIAFLLLISRSISANNAKLVKGDAENANQRCHRNQSFSIKRRSLSSEIMTIFSIKHCISKMRWKACGEEDLWDNRQI